MKKQTYLRRLRKALKGVPAREKEKLIEYYAEMIDESRERGKTDKEIFADLETPEQVAADYFNANEGPVGGLYDDYDRDRPRRRHAPRFRRDRYDDYEEPPRGRRGDRREEYEREPEYPRERRGGSGKTLVWILTFPLWLPLFIVAFALALSVFLVGVALVITAAVVTVAFFVGGVYMIVMSFGIISASGSIAAAQIGAGIALIGLCLLVSLLVGPTARGFGAFTAWVFRGFRRSGKVAVARSHGALIGKAAVGIALVVVGCGVGAFGMGKLDWQWRNIALTGEFSERTETVVLADHANLSVESDNLSLVIKPSEDGEAKLVFSDCTEFPKTFSCEDGRVTLNSGNWTTNFWENQRMVWSHGVFYSAVISVYNQAVLYLPADRIESLSLTVQNGAVRVEDVSLQYAEINSRNGYVSVRNGSFGNLSVKTNNGYVALEEITAEKVAANTDNGYVKLKNIVSDTVEADTDNGAISLSRVLGSVLRFRSGNGSVNGSLIGKTEDYKITAKTQLGSCNLKDTESGERTLDVKTGCGEIKISFVE